MTSLFTIEIVTENDVVLARQKARTVAEALKFDAQEQIRIATAVSELARNTFQYAGRGHVEFALADSLEKMLRITFQDQGDGIPNLHEILDGKYVSQTGMGLGILGAKRLMDYFHVDTSPKGTKITLGKTLPKRFARFLPGELEKLLAGIEHAARDPYDELKQQNKELLNMLEELHARQEELAQLNRELDETNRGVVALYAELNDKADFLQRASELKSHFLSNMSHEFRTPLNSITALSQLLLDHLDGELSPEQEKQVRFIRHSAQDLTTLVNDLLDLAKVEAGKISIRSSEFTVESLFAALRGMLRPLLSQNSSVNLVFDDPVDIPPLFSDEAKVSQILRNFISNALKFTERGEVRVSARRGHDETVVFSVADTGIGIEEHDQNRIFEEWTQIEGRLQKTVKGTGLGLPLSRKFAQLLGGDVYVKSQPGLGATFFAAIPLQFNGAVEAVFVPDIKQDLDPNKYPVLVVEDNREALFVYERYLKDTPFQMVQAQNLKEARSVLRRLRPMAVVLDVLLNGEHSWELLQELKQNNSTADIPVFVITVVENREKAMAMGATGFHTKPVDRSWLIMQLNDVSTSYNARQVLTIDDDEVSRYILRGILAKTDFRFIEASSGQEGLRRVRECKPNLIILDLAMPDLSGFEVLKRLKADPSTSDIPVIIHTSKVLEPEELRSLSDAVAIVSKESPSREVAFEKFSEAFSRAHVPVVLRPAQEVQHA